MVKNMTKWTEKELARIEREAYKILRGKATKVPAAKLAVMSEHEKELRKEQRRYASKIKSYKKRTGKKRLTKEEKEALHDFTPAQVQRHNEKGTDELYARRERAFEKRYGKNFERRYGESEDIKAIKKRMLEYMGPARAAKILDIEPDVPETPATPPMSPTPPTPPDEEWDTFTIVDLPSTTWRKLPIKFTAGWSHDVGFMYDNQEFFWQGSSDAQIDLNALAEVGDRSGDGMYSFFKEFMSSIDSSILFDPEGTGRFFFVYKNEWDSVEELEEDYIDTRRYRKKKE